MSSERTICNFIIGRTLGKGAFSKVKLGTDRATGHHVALKLLDIKAMDDTSKKQVEREVKALARVGNHANVIKLEALEWEAQYPKKNGKVKNVSLEVLEIAGGGELFDFISFSGAFEEHLARTYFRQFIEGLSWAHANGVAHRDIKPENVLLDARFVLKLADFGLSQIAAPDSRMRTQCGTTAYMAPEVMSHEGYDGFTADIWSAGVVLFIMLSGFPPFAKPASSDWWFDKLQKGKHELFWRAHCRTVNFSEASKDLLNKMLAPNPTKRITMDAIKQHPWYNEACISEDVLFHEMQGRKAKVDQSKEQERFEKLARQGVERIDGGDGVCVRDLEGGVEADGDELPACAPNMHGFLAKPNMQQNDAQDDDDDDDGDLAEAPEYQEVMAGYSLFEVDMSPSDVFYILRRSMASMGNAQVNPRPKSHKIKATFHQKSGQINLVAQIYREKDGKGSIVDFRRMQGDHMEYRALYNNFRAKILSEV